MRKIKKYEGGGLAPWAVGGQVLGNLVNIGVGIGQRKKGKKRYEEGREDFIGNLGASDALASASDEAAGFANLAGKQGNEKSDSALAGLLTATKSGDPRFMQTLGIDQIASDTQERGLLTAQNIASARSPLVQAEETAKDQMTGLYGQDMAEGTAAFNQGTENIMGGASGLLNMPLDMMTAEAAGVNFGLGKDGGFVKKDYASGGLIGQGSMSMKGFGGFKKDEEEEEEEEEVVNEWERWSKFNEEHGELANGGTIQQLIAEGGSFITPGEENHETQEFDIVDSETGETVAKTTGNERHENTADGLSITNSKQEQGMMDAYSMIRDPKNPTVEEARNAVLAMYKVYGLDQFNNNQA
tara:strand:- start:8937 stop:10004 length:1068 start_codon:yes stop_codon:yes gene_type:complete